MNIYYLDHPLSDNELLTAARMIGHARLTEAQCVLTQHRVPDLFPAPAQKTYPILREFVPLLRQQLQRVGIAPVRDEKAAMLLAPDNPLNGVLALTLRETSGLTPYFIVRAQGERGSLRLVDAGPLLNVLETGTDEAGPAGPLH